MLHSVRGHAAISAHFPIQCQSKADAALPLAAHCARVAGNSCRPRNQRAQGMPDARCTRGLVCNVHKKVRTRAYRAAEAIRHSLRNGFTAYIVLSLVNGLSCHHRCAKVNRRNLTPATGRQDHTTSPYASATFVSATSASTASHRAFVTCATPLLSGETGRVMPLICPTTEAEYFCAQVWTGQNRLIQLNKSASTRNRICRADALR
jgi:hypothetical protein